jgi:hypothetical protein
MKKVQIRHRQQRVDDEHPSQVTVAKELGKTARRAARLHRARARQLQIIPRQDRHRDQR